MPLFPSREWAEEAVRLTNSDPEVAAAAHDWHHDFGIVIEAEQGKLDQDFSIHVEPRGGKIARFKVLRDKDELEELEPAYYARAPFSVWKALLNGQLDPVEALLKKKIQVQGDLQPLIERARFKGIGDRVLAQIPTTYPDER